MKASTILNRSFLALFIGTLCVFSTSFLLATTINPAKDAAITYYNIAGQSITKLSSWNTQTDGNGESPAGFSLNNTIWNVIHNAVLTEPLIITGDNSKVLVGDGTNEIELALSMTSNLDALVDVINQGSLILTTNNYPTFGTFHPESRVVFATGGQRKIPYHDYYDLYIANTKPVFENEGDNTVRIRGVVVLEGTVTFPRARGEVEYNFLFHGANDQGILTNGNVFRAYNLTFEKSSGGVRLDASTIVSSDNQMTFNFTENAVFIDNGATLYAGNSVNVDGLATAYDFTGTLILAGTEPGIVNGAAAGNDFNLRNNGDLNQNPVAAFNNIIVRAANTGGQFHFRDGGSNHFEIKGNLIIDSGADGRVSFYNNRVSIGGDYIIGDGFAGTVDPFERLGLNGSDLQKIDLGKNSSTKILDVTNDIIIQQGSLVVTEVLNADATIKTSESGVLVVNTTTELNGIDEDNYIMGNMGFLLSGDGIKELEFPIGTDLRFLPLKLNITHSDPDEVMHYARAMGSGLPDINLPDELEVIYPDYFYFLSLDPSAQITAGKIALPFFTPVKEFDPAMLRVARAENDEWINLGGEINNGFISSEVPFTDGGIFSLAKYLPSSARRITSFVFSSLDPVVLGSIDEEAKTISAEVPHGTDINALVPDIQFTGVSINPGSGIAQDFSQPVKYTVTAEDNSTAEYTVTVKVIIPDNLPPFVENPVLLQQTIEKGTGITIDLTHVFADPEGEPLTFTAESSHPEMVSVQLADNILTISPVRRGGAVITIKATDNRPQSVSSDFHVLVYPEAHDLLAIPFLFDNWPANQPEFSYPESMLFLQSNMEDPELNSDLLFPYFIPEDDYHADDANNIGFPYQNTHHTRINGLGNEGISFINTGRDRDLGGALAAINTSGIQGARVGWTAATITQNVQVYAIRLQYRTDIAADFADLLDENGNVVEYKVNTDGHTQVMDPVKLPPALDNQPYVQLLWRYYWVEGDSGARPELRLDDIAITWTMNAEVIRKPSVLIFNQGNRITLTKSTDELALIEIYDLSGRRVHSASVTSAGTHTWSLPVQSGVYMVRYQSSEEQISRKIMIR